MHFVKMHGLGNDFLIIEDYEAQKIASIKNFAISACDRHFGVGGDGVILVQPSQKADIRMRIFNSDGSEAEMCGNGIRCLAKYAYERGFVPDPILTVETEAGIIIPEIILEDERVKSIRVDMGQPYLDSKEIPVTIDKERIIQEPIEVLGKTFYFTAVSMGNPHAVIFGIPDQWQNYGEAIEKHPFFPRKTNVEFVYCLSPYQAEVKVWERGAGPTLACGTGACAVLVAGVLNQKLSRKAEIKLPGGSLIIEWSTENQHVYMEGPAQEVFSAELSEEVYEKWMLQRA
ncbi:MAG: diaminopimelate epimerase [Candidatus Atribacteria bacterium]|nr:diaminopimelate epimerase [Candidatus Atribacteria bacterium]